MRKKLNALLIFQILLTLLSCNSKKIISNNKIQNPNFIECKLRENIINTDSLKSGKYKYYTDCLKQKSDNEYLHVKNLYKTYNYKTLTRSLDLDTTNFWTYIYHYEKDLFFLRKVLRNLKKDKTVTNYYYRIAFISDKINVLSNKKQIYGTQTKFNNSGKLIFITKIKDSINVNSRRTKMKLEPLEVDIEKSIMLEKILKFQDKKIFFHL